MSLTVEQSKNLFYILDRNRDGELDASEMSKHARARLDKDLDGRVTGRELARVLTASVTEATKPLESVAREIEEAEQRLEDSQRGGLSDFAMLMLALFLLPLFLIFIIPYALSRLFASSEAKDAREDLAEAEAKVRPAIEQLAQELPSGSDYVGAWSIERKLDFWGVRDKGDEPLPRISGQHVERRLEQMAQTFSQLSQALQRSGGGSNREVRLLRERLEQDRSHLAVELEAAIRFNNVE